METKLAVPISSDNLEGAKGQIEGAVSGGAEMLELRVDYLKELSVDLVRKLIAEAKEISDLPLIVTCRDKAEGGATKWPLELRTTILVEALKAGAEFIDFEFKNFLAVENQERIELALAESSKGRLILSAHNFKTKFDNISELYRHITTVYPAAIPKLVFTANHINDCFEALDLLSNSSGERIVFCMGEAGLISRIIAKKLGSFVSFASLDEESATAPGQLTIERFRKLYRWDSINSETELYGVIGSPVGHSLSPAIHNACFGDAGLNKLYLPLLIQGGADEFDCFLDNVLVHKWLGFRGFSVTIPHKANALEYTKGRFGSVEPLAEKIGAVNTIIITGDGELCAYNTDYAGALDAITSALGAERADLEDLPVAVVGAGGVSRAIVAGLSDANAKIKIYNRTVRKAEKLAAEFSCEFAGLGKLTNLDAKLVINCTSIGMYPNVHQTPVSADCIEKDMVVFDTVYNPAETLLLKQAKAIGAKTVSGVDMFINQAAEQFKLFTGKDANTDLMRKVVSEKI